MSALLDVERLTTIPRRIPAIRRVVVLQRTDSTNDDSRRLGAEGAVAWTVVISGCQGAGRGRLGRSWYSAEGLGLYISVLLRPARPIAEAARWSLAAAAAAADACAETGARGIEIKWPNDVLACGRKIAGILSELRTSSDGAPELIVGAGFNVHHEASDFPEALRPAAASLGMSGARPTTTRESLAESWLKRFAELAGELDRGGWNAVSDRWTAWARGSHGTAVRVLSTGPGGEARTGVTRGIDENGALRVETADGETIAVRIAESVVPLGG